jgi:RimJ/RimL family protein N-acetyltransferase
MSAGSAYELMKVHVATLFAIDDGGRLRYVREPGDSPAPPRFFMGRTPQGNVWHFRHDLPDGLVDDLEHLCRAEPHAPDPSSPPRGAAAIRNALQAHASIAREERGPAYVCLERAQPPGSVVRITKENARRLEAMFPWLHRRILDGVDLGPVVASVVDDAVASLCYCARLSSSAAEAGVVTLEALRRRGHATAAVAGWAAAVRDEGLLPLYSTTWENLPSQRVAHKLGMVAYGEDWSIE